MWDVWLRVSWGGRVGVGCVAKSELGGKGWCGMCD